MPEPILEPDDCRTMAELREAVDALDAELFALLVRRFAYMRAAARIKPEREAVRDEARKAQVIDNVCALAEGEGISGDGIAELWDRLIERSIAYEMERWEAKRGG